MMASLGSKDHQKVWFAVAAGSFAIGIVGLGLMWYLDQRTTDGQSTEKKKKHESLNQYEQRIEADFIHKDSLQSSFDDIGGLDGQIAEVQELVIYPLSHPHLYRHSAVVQQPTGVLLYGPPGTGKTLLARAIAKTAKASFLSVNVASVENKYYGETPKYIEAIFSLARARSPCVIFIDEIDGLLSARSEIDIQAINTMKTKFMECWDGIATPDRSGRHHNAKRTASTKPAGAGKPGAGKAADDTEDENDGWVLVIGATNKPWALDPAVLRRMPRQIFVGLPDAAARESILRVILRREVVEPDLDLATVAELTEGYSGSDLKEVARAAALVPIREAFERERAMKHAAPASPGPAAACPGIDDAPHPSSAAPGTKEYEVSAPRAITTQDLLDALDVVRPTGSQARAYQAFKMQQDRGRGGTAAMPSDFHSKPKPVQGSTPASAAAAAAGNVKDKAKDGSSGPAGGSPGPIQFGSSTRENSRAVAAAAEQSVAGK